MNAAKSAVMTAPLTPGLVPQGGVTQPQFAPMLAVAKAQDEEDMLLQSWKHALDPESACKLEWVDPQGQMSADQLRHRVEELCSDPHWAVANAGTCRAVLDELFETRSRNDMCEELNKARELWLQHAHDKGTLPEESSQSHIDHSAMIADRLAARGTAADGLSGSSQDDGADDAHIALDQFDRMLEGRNGKGGNGIQVDIGKLRHFGKNKCEFRSWGRFAIPAPVIKPWQEYPGWFAGAMHMNGFYEESSHYNCAWFAEGATERNTVTARCKEYGWTLGIARLPANDACCVCKGTLPP